MRHLLSTLLLSTALVLPGLETPLVMSQAGANGGFVAIATPSGGLRVYKGGGKQFDLLWSGSFYTELFALANQPHPEVSTYTLLRVGASSNPPYIDMLNKMLPPPKGSKENTLRTAAINGENTFWGEKPPLYDGNVRGAFASNSLFLVVPSMRAALLYTLNNGALELTAYRNIGPDFYLGGYNTMPDPNELLRQLPKDSQEQFSKIFEERQQAMADNPEAGITLKEMDPWVAAATANTFVVLEPNNQRLLTYRVNNKTLDLMAARNLEVDLLIPPEAALNSKPDPKTQYRDYEKAMKAAKRTPYTPKDLQALAQTFVLPGVKSLPANDSGLQAALDNKANLTLDFTAKRKLLYYNPDASGKIELLSLRDYSLETGIAIQTEMIKREALGQAAYKNAVTLAGRIKSNEDLRPFLVTLRFALTYNPGLFEQAEKERAFLSKKVNEDPAWAPMIKDAVDAKAKQDADEAKRKELLERWEQEEQTKR